MKTYESLKIVKKFCENFIKGNRTAMMQEMADDVQWIYPGEPDIYYAGTFTGKAAVPEFFKRLASSVETLEFSTKDFIAQDTRVAVTGFIRGYSISTENEFESEWTMIFELKDQKIKRCQTYLDTAKIAAAFWVA